MNPGGKSTGNLRNGTVRTPFPSTIPTAAQTWSFVLRVMGMAVENHRLYSHVLDI
ncbi:protein of unknown function [Xenorhabdus doucetiae]|uniref:Uncharacterized protein n=1 Tax=Xenorhabdus doucetiae TaxID=351671 RepID=A0A068QPX6_9GAMM|nr:protein of unknown function [Xenorhabdus doucetiae]